MFKTLFAEETEETRRLLGSMATEPVKEAVDPAREADSAPPTVLHGTLTVEVPGGETMVLKTTFDSGSNTDAVSEKVAMQLKKLGVPWGEAGGGVSMAVSSSVAVPHGELRLLLSAEPTGRDGREEEQLAIPGYGTAMHGTARHGTARHGTARHGTPKWRLQTSSNRHRAEEGFRWTVHGA